MKVIGIDIGTTSICGVLVDTEIGRMLQTKSLQNSSNLPASTAGRKAQNPKIILDLCKQLLQGIIKTNPDVTSIGVTGQMHGIVYLNQEGELLSPLYTWLDGCGNLPFENETSYASYLTEKTGYPMATGYGLTTHFYNLKNDLVPKGTAYLCTMPDYIAMTLAGSRTPTMHTTNAAGLGLFDVKQACFDQTALDACGIDSSLIPEVTNQSRTLGDGLYQIPVSIAIGDNQASYLGATNEKHSILFNVGTGSQISVACDTFLTNTLMEVRPYLNTSYLLVASSLSGGYSYHLLREFFEKTFTMLHQEKPADIYSYMNEAAWSVYKKKEHLIVDTRFNGTRENPVQRGSIQNMGLSTFTPAHLTLGVLKGICEELYEYYEKLPEQVKSSDSIICSGNGIRRNRTLKQIFKDALKTPLKIPAHQEESAFGAGLHSLLSLEQITLEEAQKLIQYEIYS